MYLMYYTFFPSFDFFLIFSVKGSTLVWYVIAKLKHLQAYIFTLYYLDKLKTIYGEGFLPKGTLFRLQTCRLQKNSGH